MSSHVGNSSPPRRSGRRRGVLIAGVVAAVGGSLARVPLFQAGAAENAVIETFDGATVGQTPSGWSVAGSGSAKVQQPATGGVQAKALLIEDTSATESLRVSRGITQSSDAVVAGLRIAPAQTNAVLGVHLWGSDKQAVTVGLGADGRWYTFKGSEKVDLGTYRAGQFYDLRIVAHPGRDTATVHLDGRQVAAGIAFRAAVEKLDRLQVTVSQEAKGAASIDDVRLGPEATATPFPYLGTVKQRDASTIGGSDIIVGTETTDRDYAIYASYQKYLGPLGAKAARHQPGWAKVEKTKGVLDFSAPKKELENLVAQGIRPWINVSYGNPEVYPETVSAGSTKKICGEIGSGAAVPTPACKPWSVYVERLCQTVKDVVGNTTDPRLVPYFELWNEPELSKTNPVPVAEAAEFFQRTARIVKGCYPQAKILAISAAGIFKGANPVSYFEEVIAEIVKLEKKRLAEDGNAGTTDRNALDLVDAITFHSYQGTADDRFYYQQLADVRKRLAGTYGSQGMRVPPLWMGEHGFPSRPGCCALGELATTELIQAKANARRVLGDLGTGVPTNIFGISDMVYPYGTNTKGLVRINEATKEVTYAKPAYYAMQTLTSIFDNTLEAIPGYGGTAFNQTSPQSPLSAYGFKHKTTGRQVAAIWEYGPQSKMPSDDTVRKPVTVALPGGDFTDPVYVDVRTGEVHDIPSGNWSKSGSTYTFTGLPVGDSPVLIADRSLVRLA